MSAFASFCMMDIWCTLRGLTKPILGRLEVRMCAAIQVEFN